MREKPARRRTRRESVSCCVNAGSAAIVDSVLEMTGSPRSMSMNRLWDAIHNPKRSTPKVLAAFTLARPVFPRRPHGRIVRPTVAGDEPFAMRGPNHRPVECAMSQEFQREAPAASRGFRHYLGYVEDHTISTSKHPGPEV